MVSASTPGFPSGYGVSESGGVNFSRDGSRLFLSCAPLDVPSPNSKSAPAAPTGPEPAIATSSADDKVLADLWIGGTTMSSPCRRCAAAQERARRTAPCSTLRRRSTSSFPAPTWSARPPATTAACRYGTDDRAYRHMVEYDGSYNDLYIVDTNTGARTSGS